MLRRTLAHAPSMRYTMRQRHMRGRAAPVSFPDSQGASVNMETPAPRAGASRWEAHDPFPWYERMRRESPVSVDPNSGALSVFRYGGVQRVLSDFEAFSSERG